MAPGPHPETPRPKSTTARTAYGLILRAALTQTGEHPEITFRRDALLRSINDRLGALVQLQCPGSTLRKKLTEPGNWILDPGQDIEPLSRRYLSELLEFAVANHEDLEADFEERVSEMRQGADG